MRQTRILAWFVAAVLLVTMAVPIGMANASLPVSESADHASFGETAGQSAPLQPTAALGDTAVEPDALIQLMIDRVDSDTVRDYDGGLSGEWPVIVGGGPYTITQRATCSGIPIGKATQYVGEHFDSLGLDVAYHEWNYSGCPEPSATYPNVIGELLGTVNPEEIYIISAHLDAAQGAPGADDNASGSAAVMIAADILSRYRWGCTLRFAVWTGEEQGMLGSKAYAQHVYDRGENILGVLNLDMIGYNSVAYPEPDIEFHAKSSVPSTLLLAQLAVDVVDAYDLNLVPEIVPDGTSLSDHSSFWNKGYPAILGIEDFQDFNPDYHAAGDDLDNLDLVYFTEYVKAAVAISAHMSGCLIGPKPYFTYIPMVAK